MAAKVKSESFDFVLTLLEKNPSIAYADVAAAAQKKGFKIFPIVYGRAKAKLGLVPTAPRGTGVAARARKKADSAAAAANASRVARPTAAPRNSSNGRTFDGLESVISHVKNSEAERERFRGALVKIQAILESALH